MLRCVVAQVKLSMSGLCKRC